MPYGKWSLRFECRKPTKLLTPAGVLLFATALAGCSLAAPSSELSVPVASASSSAKQLRLEIAMAKLDKARVSYSVAAQGPGSTMLANLTAISEKGKRNVLSFMHGTDDY